MNAETTSSEFRDVKLRMNCTIIIPLLPVFPLQSIFIRSFFTACSRKTLCPVCVAAVEELKIQLS